MFGPKVRNFYLVPEVRSRAGHVLSGIRATLGYKAFGHIEFNPYVFEIKFSYTNSHQMKSMIEKYGLNTKHADYFFYSDKLKTKIEGVIINSEQALHQVLSELTGTDGIEILVGETIIGGKYDAEAKAIVETNIAEMKHLVELNQTQSNGRTR